ncbi:MAG TPA: nucleotide exchange factor GrpE [Gammaproteobacteria bacterium]|nr:nucleotide exchange factor GrpE [Gammaproteobacteria bacterium]
MTNNKQSTPDAPESGDNVEGVVEEGAAQGEAPSHDELTLLLEDARSKADEHWDQLLRANAELDNLRRRAKQDVENAHKYALEKFAQELLPVKDSLEMGLAAASGEVDAAEALKQLREGTELTLKMLSTAMEKAGIKEIDPLGEAFNPELHQAMSMQESEEHDPNTVIAVMQKGYQLNDRLIRPAMVVVSKAKA